MVSHDDIDPPYQEEHHGSTLPTAGLSAAETLPQALMFVVVLGGITAAAFYTTGPLIGSAVLVVALLFGYLSVASVAPGLFNSGPSTKQKLGRVRRSLRGRLKLSDDAWALARAVLEHGLDPVWLRDRALTCPEVDGVVQVEALRKALGPAGKLDQPPTDG